MIKHVQVIYDADGERCYVITDNILHATFASKVEAVLCARIVSARNGSALVIYDKKGEEMYSEDFINDPTRKEMESE